MKVARKFWTWLLNPVPVSVLPKGKCLYIQRPSKERSNEDDSYGSESDGEDEGFSYDQPEPMDNLIDHQMALDFLAGKIGPEQG